jgi:uncharacterized protein (DUF1778 family)
MSRVRTIAPRTERLDMLLSAEDRKNLVALAQLDGRSITATVVELIRDAVNDRIEHAKMDSVSPYAPDRKRAEAVLKALSR